MCQNQKVMNTDKKTKHGSKCGLLAANQFICDAYSKMSQISPQRYEFSIPEEIGHGYFRQVSTHQGIIVSEFRMCYKRDKDVMGRTDTPNIALLKRRAKKKVVLHIRDDIPTQKLRLCLSEHPFGTVKWHHEPIIYYARA